MLKTVSGALRTLIGVMFLAFFLLAVLGWKPPEVSTTAQSLRSALLEAGYFFPIIYGVFLLVGAACVTNRFVPLAAIILFPITLNSVLYHAFLNPPTLWISLFLMVPNLFLIYVSWESYRPLLRAGHG
jgi:hypothetical protein